jgi:hypothetical protein
LSQCLANSSARYHNAGSGTLTRVRPQLETGMSYGRSRLSVSTARGAPQARFLRRHVRARAESGGEALTKLCSTARLPSPTKVGRAAPDCNSAKGPEGPRSPGLRYRESGSVSRRRSDTEPSEAPVQNKQHALDVDTNIVAGVKWSQPQKLSNRPLLSKLSRS